MALRHAYIQPNGPGMDWAMVYDVDRRIVDPRSLVAVWDAAGLPPPNFATISPDTGRGHLVYMLAAGVCKTSAARVQPLRYAAAIQRAMTAKLGADPGYAGLITKNPLHHRWQTWEIHGQEFSLGELAEYLDLSANAKQYTPTESRGLGRNCTLFDALRFWAYKAISDYWAPDGLPRWHKAVLARAEALNGQFPEPLPYSEVQSTAKSVAKWTWCNLNPQGRQALIERTHTPELQAKRGRMANNHASAGVASGEARRAAREDVRAKAQLLRSKGMTYRQIAEEMHLSLGTVNNYLNSDDGDNPV